MQSAHSASLEIRVFTVFSICCKMVAWHHWSARGSTGISTGRWSAERGHETSKEPIEAEAGAAALM